MTTHLVPPPGDRFNFAQHLFERNAARPMRPAFIDDRAVLAYGELEAHARRLGAALLAAGVRREERVLLLMHDCNDWPVAFLGAMHAGIVPVAVNTLLTADDYAHMLRGSRAQAALVSAALLPVLRSAMAQGGHELHTLVVSRPQGEGEGEGEGDLPAARSPSTRCSPAPRRSPRPLRPGPTIPASGSIPPARPAGRRRRCTRRPICTGPPSCTARRCSA